MRAFKLVEIDNTLLVVITNPRLAAAVKAFDYAWHDRDAEDDDGDDDRTETLIVALDRFYSASSQIRPS
ncbi:MAG: hypothetical protein KDJ88_20825 [Bauldia sp.]|nr:hypothetical protein [Bauldia sp.]